MDAPRSTHQPYRLPTPLFPSDPVSYLGLDVTELNDDGFPADLPSVARCELEFLCNELFVGLDSETPDLRAMERYQAICDELSHRELSAGAA